MAKKKFDATVESAKNGKNPQLYRHLKEDSEEPEVLELERRLDVGEDQEDRDLGGTNTWAALSTCPGGLTRLPCIGAKPQRSQRVGRAAIGGPLGTSAPTEAACMGAKK